MRRLFALVLVVFLWIGFAPPASADMAGLTPCGDSPAFLQRAKNATTPGAKARFERYAESQVLCGPEGLPHLIVDGRLDHAGEFLIPGLLFLYIAGWIGWAGRSYIIAIRKEGNPEEKEIIIDIPLALKLSLAALAWPATALKEILSGEIAAKNEEITVSPR